jgi:hypothetical protein
MKTYKIILVRGHSRGEELGEYPPKAPRFGSRTFISPCNLRHWVVCGGTRFLRRYRYSAPLRAVHTCWPQYPSLGSATRCAEIATRDNYWDGRSTGNWGVFPGASCAQCSSFRLGKMVRRKIRCPTRKCRVVVQLTAPLPNALSNGRDRSLGLGLWISILLRGRVR